ncbi:hypothetical protein MMC20_001332 [Loxospora ochrophaea]|nr:hypothetical protein [Loxospora ochrophaea]
MANRHGAAGLPQSQPYIPKLSYRKTFTESSDPSPRWSIRTTSTSATDGTTTTTLTTPTSPSHSDYFPSPRSPQFSLETPNSQIGLSDTTQQYFPSQKSQVKLTKKKSSSFFKFLTVKEPSTQAWLDYQESLRKQNAGQNKDNGRVSAVGLPMVSSAKLPRTVPKVNSKWDGVPESVKEKEKRLKAGNRMSTHSQASGPVATRGDNLSRTSSSASLGSKLSRDGRSLLLDSSSTSARSASPLRASSISSGSDVKDFGDVQIRSRSCPTTTPLDTISYLPPDVPAPPEIPEIYRKKSEPGSTHGLDVPRHSASPSLTPTDPSPCTPPFSSPLIPFKTEVEDQQPLSSITNLTIAEADGHSPDRVIVRSAGADVLAPPSAVRHYAKASPSASDEKQNKSPTQKTKPQLQPILKYNTTSRTGPGPTRPPLSSYSPAIRIGNEDRPSTSRDRLGLGVGLKRSPLIAPWDSPQSDLDVRADGGRVAQSPSGYKGLLRRSKTSIFGGA